MLLGKDLELAQRLLGRELRQVRLGVLVGLVVATLPVEPKEPVELQGLAGRAQPVADVPIESFDVDADLVEPRLGHLGRNGALPDKCVEAELVAVECGRQALRGA